MRWFSLATTFSVSASMVAPSVSMRAIVSDAPGRPASSSSHDAGERRAEAGAERSSGEIGALATAVALAALGGSLRVKLIEPDLAPDPEPLRGLDAFVVRELDGSLRQVIYVNRQSEIIQRAAAGSSLYVGILAAVLHHEAQHLAGASEEDARRAELAFFDRLIARGDVPAEQGRHYLQLLNRSARVMLPVSP